MTRQPKWTDRENRNVIALYFEMLDHAMAGDVYNKAAMIRYSQGSDDPADLGSITEADFIWDTLGERSRGSIEAKLMNVSACHRDLTGGTTMDGFGYRCMSNYQADLKVWTKEAIDERQLDADVAMSALNEQRAGA